MRVFYVILCGKIAGSCEKLREDAGGCGKLRKVAERCGKLRKVAEYAKVAKYAKSCEICGTWEKKEILLPHPVTRLLLNERGLLDTSYDKQEY